MFDLRPLYAFDSSEGQIPEGFASVYGPANSHANCVPASFTAALALAGFGDIDPQRLTNEIYGPNYRGGFGNFSKTIAWIKANVPSAPAFSDAPFDFNVAEAAGQNGQLIVVAGWIDAASVTFVSESMAAGFSHASLLVAHLADDEFVIWNTWTGQMQTYDRAVLAESLYEMSIAAGLHGASQGEIDMAVADDILRAVTVMPPKPARFAGQTDAQLKATITDVSGWPQIKAVYAGAGEYEYLQAVAHPELQPSVGTAIARLLSGGIDSGALAASLVAALKPILAPAGGLTAAQAVQLTQIVTDAHVAAGVVPDLAAIAHHIGVGTP
jgi:hypothetical protein